MTKVIELNGKKYVLNKPSIREILGTESKIMNATDDFYTVLYKEMLSKGLKKPKNINDFAWDIEQSTEEINGKKYTFQNLDIVATLEMNSRIRAAGDMNYVVEADELLEHIVVKPRVTIEDFENDRAGLRDVLKAAKDFVNDNENLKEMTELCLEIQGYLFEGKN